MITDVAVTPVGPGAIGRKSSLSQRVASRLEDAIGTYENAPSSD
jgi:hypothetical protein